MQRRGQLTYAGLATEVEDRFPSLAARLHEERVLWEPDPVGGDIVLSDIFVPFFVNAIRLLPESCATVVEGARFIEDIASSDDESLRNAARISDLQAFEDYVGLADEIGEQLGPAARGMLPTRGPE